jgi:hypothetical protein
VGAIHEAVALAIDLLGQRARLTQAAEDARRFSARHGGAALRMAERIAALFSAPAGR